MHNNRLGRDEPVAAIRLAFVGDICLAGGLQADLRKRGSDHPFSAVKRAFESADLVIGNLECCIVDHPAEVDPPPNIMTVPESLASGLPTSGINIVSLSNNHILDGGELGLISTTHFLDKHRIRHFGAGCNLDEAERPLFLECKGRRIAFLGACDVPLVFGADAKCGVPPMVAKRLGRRVAKCKEAADIVVVSIHADLEFTSYPAPSRVRLSRWLVEQGADLVVQHHPHVCQGVEFHEDGLIAYSLGNFIFRVQGNEYFMRHQGTDWGLVLLVDVNAEVNRNKINYELVPVTINADNQTVLSTGEDRERQLSMLSMFSDGLGDWRVVRRARMARCLAEARMNLYGLYYLWRRQGISAAFKSGFSTLKNPYERRWMYSLMSMGMLG